MSDRVADSVSGAAQGAKESVGRLFDSQGRSIQRASDQAQDTLGEVREYIRDQPFSAAAIAIGIGYILGRLRIF